MRGSGLMRGIDTTSIFRRRTWRCRLLWRRLYGGEGLGSSGMMSGWTSREDQNIYLAFISWYFRMIDIDFL